MVAIQVLCLRVFVRCSHMIMMSMPWSTWPPLWGLASHRCTNSMGDCNEGPSRNRSSQRLLGNTTPPQLEHSNVTRAIVALVLLLAIDLTIATALLVLETTVVAVATAAATRATLPTLSPPPPSPLPTATFVQSHGGRQGASDND